MENKRNSSARGWDEVAWVAARQLGLVTRQQLRQAGVHDSRVAKAIAAKRLHPVFHGVFCVGHGYLGPDGRLLAATLACGRGSVISHGTAARLLGLRDWRPTEIDVIAPVEGGRKIAGIRRRFVPPPGEREVGTYCQVPTTGVARTIVDLAGILRGSALAGVIEQAAVLGRLDVERIDAILDGPRRRGATRLLRAIEPWRGHRPGARFRSRIEARLFPLLAVAGLPIPTTNARIVVAGKRFEVDFLWRPQKLIVETDSRFHDTPDAEVRDAERNRVFPAAGYQLARFGWEDLRDRPEQTLAEIVGFLRRTPHRPVPFVPQKNKRNSSAG
jgi:hypothetical protein